MPTQHIRYCTHCARMRFAGCTPTCQIPGPDWDDKNWHTNPAYTNGSVETPNRGE